MPLMSPREIAKRSRFSTRYIQLLMAGKRRPSADAAKRLAKCTGVDRLGWLYPDEYPNPYVSERAADE